MTDDSNGDALFTDDIFTALGDQVRLSQIDEIRSGAGDDIVDLTSLRYESDNGGIRIYGGLGNDIIWTDSGNNTLFGDGGNDRLTGGSGNDIIIGGSGDDTMHGGGGNDIFCFGSKFGSDIIEQVNGGNVTLWFESGSESSWNAETMTYFDGINLVQVTGTSADNITLKFGGDISVLPDGAFLDAASEKIFEDKSKGMIA
jgi:Ca2+-binding RTX toxin-like protein